MLILRPVIHQQQYTRRRHTLTEESQESLGFAVQPVQILKDENEGLVETLPHQQPLDRLKRSAVLNLGVHLLQRRIRLGDPQQGKEIGQRVFQTTIKSEHFASDLLSLLPLIIMGSELKVVLQQLYEWEIGIRFAMREREGLQHQAAELRA